MNFPQIGKSGTSYNEETYNKLTPLEKKAEGFIHDPSVVYMCGDDSLDDMRFFGNIAISVKQNIKELVFGYHLKRPDKKEDSSSEKEEIKENEVNLDNVNVSIENSDLNLDDADTTIENGNINLNDWDIMLLRR